MNRIIQQKQIKAFIHKLYQDEKTEGTIEKYRRDVNSFSQWLKGKSITKENVICWREYLLSEGYAPVTINSMLSAVNVFLEFMNWEDCRVKSLRIQQRLFREPTKELTQSEYRRLVKTANASGKIQLALVMETICATGIRVSEIKNITVEAAKNNRAEISLKGKIRVILIPHKICCKLLQYAKKEKIVSGEIFLTKSGTSLSRKQIWSDMKMLCKRAQVEASKVFPHNLRHLFAISFYSIAKDIAKLADVLGHTNIETTRIYLRTTGTEHLRQLEKLELIN